MKNCVTLNSYVLRTLFSFNVMKRGERRGRKIGHLFEKICMRNKKKINEDFSLFK